LMLSSMRGFSKADISSRIDRDRSDLVGPVWVEGNDNED